MSNNIDYRKDLGIKGEPKWHKQFRENHFSHFCDEVRAIKRMQIVVLAAVLGTCGAIIANFICG